MILIIGGIIMKFNKIIALSTCAMMAFSAVASAAGNVYLSDGYATIKNVPTLAEVENRELNITADVTSIATFAEAKTAGLSAGRGVTLSDDEYDFYQVDMNVSNFGDLIQGTDEGTDGANFKRMCIQLFAAKLSLKTTTIKKATVVAANSTNDGVAFGSAVIDSEDCSTQWGGDKLRPSTTADEGVINDNTFSLNARIVVAVPEATDTSFDVTPYVSYNYIYDGTGVNTTAAVTKANVTATLDGTSTGSKIKFASATTPVVKDIAIDASAEATTATGYVWNVALTNAAKINEFKATFKADGAKDAVKYIRNIADVASAISGEGSLNFQVGVLTDTTTKTNATATFDVKDSDGKTASATVAAK